MLLRKTIRRVALSIITLSADVKRATELIRSCRARLRKAEEEVAEILGEEQR